MKYANLKCPHCGVWSDKWKSVKHDTPKKVFDTYTCNCGGESVWFSGAPLLLRADDVDASVGHIVYTSKLNQGVNEMKELKTYRDLFQASLDGHDIEYWNEYRGEWLPSISEWYFSSRNLDKEIEEIGIGKYRIKVTYPSIDWSHVSEKYTCLARDKNGSCFLHENRPEIDDEYWRPEIGVAITASVFQSLEVGNCDWTESLVERPRD